MKQATIYDSGPEWTPAQREEWMTEAKCAEIGGDAWFPELRGDKATDAKRVCNSCPVIAECAEFALRTDQRFGIWAGLNAPELRRIRGQRRSESYGEG